MSEFKINERVEIVRTCPTCGQDYTTIGGTGQKSGSSPAVHIDDPKGGKVTGYCSSVCMAKALGQDITESLAYKALKEMGMDPLKMLGPKKMEKVDPEKYLSLLQYILQMKLQGDSEITNFELGWLKLPWITDEIDIDYQRYAAKLVSFLLSPQIIRHDRVIPVPLMGLPFATTLAEELGILLNMSRKSKHVPNSWQNPVVTPNKPYLNGGLAYHAYHFKPGQRLLPVDDILGDGDTIVPVITGLREHGAQIDHAAFYVVKGYREGHLRLLDMGVRPVGALHIMGFTPEGKFGISPII